jgi:hypothetical protein
MDRVRCAQCGEEHDLLAVEPNYGRPDAFFEVPADQREHLTNFGNDDGRIRTPDDRDRRHFLRVLLAVPIRGTGKDCAWGVWVEVSAFDWERTYELWDDPKQSKVRPFPARLANTLRGYENTVGLPGRVRLVAPKQSPLFVLDEDVDHPIAREQREGVTPERVTEWVTAHHH